MLTSTIAWVLSCTEDKRYSEAAAVYETLAKIDAKDPFVYIEWANIFFSQKQADEAIAVLEKGVSAGIRDAGLYTALGYARSLKNDTGADVLRLYNMALEIKPDSPAAHFYLGAYYDRIKDRDGRGEAVARGDTARSGLPRRL